MRRNVSTETPNNAVKIVSKTKRGDPNKISARAAGGVVVPPVVC